ncbi:MAG: acyltransferase family protein [Rhodomicrobium sp.]
MTDLKMNTSTVRFRALDSWRGICALIVALYHFEPLGRLYSGHLRSISIIGNGWLFVDFFFVLSGFVIYYTYSEKLTDRASILNFVIRRFGRVWPLHAAILVMLIAIELAKLYSARHGAVIESQPFTEVYAVPSILTNIALVQALGLDSILTWNIPSWSISVEFYTYLIFACSLYCLRWRHAAIPLIFAIASAIALFSFSSMEATHGFSLFRCLFGFYIGASVSIMFPRIDAHLPRSNLRATTLEICAILAAITVVMAAKTDVAFAAPIVFGFVVIVFARERGIISGLVTTTPFTFLGERSYSIYMLHFVVLLTMTRFIKAVSGAYTNAARAKSITLIDSNIRIVYLGSDIAADCIVLIFIAALLIASSLTYKFIENPGRKFFNSLAGRLAAPARLPAKPASNEHGGGHDLVPSHQR